MAMFVRQPMKSLRTLRIVGIVSLTVVAFALLWQAGGGILVFGVVLMGAVAPVGMRAGIESAPEENFHRRTTRMQYALLTILLLSVFGFPSALVGARYGVVPAISSFWIMLFAVAPTFQLMERWFGPIKIPLPQDQSVMSDSGADAIQTNEERAAP